MSISCIKDATKFANKKDWIFTGISVANVGLYKANANKFKKLANDALPNK